MYCCHGFKNCVENAGGRGISVLVYKFEDKIKFILQSRGIAFEDEAKILPLAIDYNINVACDTGLNFCPACGKLLMDLVKANQKHFESLIEIHQKFRAHN